MRCPLETLPFWVYASVLWRLPPVLQFGVDPYSSYLGVCHGQSGSSSSWCCVNLTIVMAWRLDNTPLLLMFKVLSHRICTLWPHSYQGGIRRASYPSILLGDMHSLIPALSLRVLRMKKRRINCSRCGYAIDGQPEGYLIIYHRSKTNI